MNPISRSTEYAIRALTYLAQRQEDGAFHLARDMAEKLDIPAPFLGKILQPLVTREVLESQRGRNGGFRLCVKPEEITMLKIAQSQETQTGGRECFLGQAECSDERACPLHDYWKVASTEFDTRMEKTSLADLTAFCEASPNSGYPCGTPESARGQDSAPTETATDATVGEVDPS